MLTADQISSLGGTPVSTGVLDQSNYSVYQKECAGCFRVKEFGHFQRDASYRDGVRDLCNDCINSPKLSTEEHTHDQREKNYRAAGKERWEKQWEWMESDECRSGRMLHSSEIYGFLKRANPRLFFMDGNIADDISIFLTYGTPQPDLNGNTFRYTGYMPQGWLPEFSLIEYGPQDQPVRERKRGWRTVMLRMIKAGIVTEDQVNEVFGRAYGVGAAPYNRQLQAHRSQNL